MVRYFPQTKRHIITDSRRKDGTINLNLNVEKDDMADIPKSLYEVMRN